MVSPSLSMDCNWSQTDLSFIPEETCIQFHKLLTSLIIVQTGCIVEGVDETPVELPNATIEEQVSAYEVEEEIIGNPQTQLVQHGEQTKTDLAVSYIQVGGEYLASGIRWLGEWAKWGIER